MIPEGNTLEDIKAREQIIRQFYRDWKEKNPSQRRFNIHLNEYINIRMVSIYWHRNCQTNGWRKA